VWSSRPGTVAHVQIRSAQMRIKMRLMDSKIAQNATGFLHPDQVIVGIGHTLLTSGQKVSLHELCHLNTPQAKQHKILKVTHQEHHRLTTTQANQLQISKVTHHELHELIMPQAA
jgi:hypothetical protein